MSREQKELLYKITCLHSDQFYLAMKDRWTTDDYIKNNQYEADIRQYETQYINTYGALPHWDGLIDNVWATQTELKNELEQI
jgi:hypothetical protein